MNIDKSTTYTITDFDHNSVELGARELTDLALFAQEEGLVPAPAPVVLPAPNLTEAELYRTGHKIAAIKEYRARTRAGLKESKDAIEAVSPVRAEETQFRLIYSDGTASSWMHTMINGLANNIFPHLTVDKIEFRIG